MPLEDIVNKIADKASQEAAGILGEAKEKARLRLKDATDKALAVAEKDISDAKEAIQRDTDIIVARAETERRQAVLGKKQDLVEGVFDEALASLKNMPEDDYRKLLVEAIVRSSSGGEEIVLGSDDRQKLGTEFSNMLKAGLKARGKSEQVKIQYDDHVSGGGFILKRGGISLNATFPAVLKKLSDELEIEVARILFME